MPMIDDVDGEGDGDESPPPDDDDEEDGEGEDGEGGGEGEEEDLPPVESPYYDDGGDGDGGEGEGDEGGEASPQYVAPPPKVAAPPVTRVDPLPLRFNGAPTWVCNAIVLPCSCCSLLHPARTHQCCVSTACPVSAICPRYMACRLTPQDLTLDVSLASVLRSVEFVLSYTGTAGPAGATAANRYPHRASIFGRIGSVFVPLASQDLPKNDSYVTRESFL